MSRIIEDTAKYKNRIASYRQGRFDRAAAEKPKYIIQPKFNKEVFNQGAEWYTNGLSLDEAPDNVKNDKDFINGFKHAERKRMSEEIFYQHGVELFESGLSLDDAPENQKNNAFFIQGYEDASKKKNIRK